MDRSKCSIIGAGSLVTKNIEPFSIAYGTPAKIKTKLIIKDKKQIKNPKILYVDAYNEYLNPTEKHYLTVIKNLGATFYGPGFSTKN